ncbi:MAG: hypothetical protein WC934_04795 [Acidithiobacillus sp.]|jgi:hypothetical protein|uniref:hypothetical protein n=1 Tax=Acidithiobacillus sp. TaxID=1872118 RepID=UPI003560125C
MTEDHPLKFHERVEKARKDLKKKYKNKYVYVMNPNHKLTSFDMEDFEKRADKCQVKDIIFNTLPNKFVILCPKDIKYEISTSDLTHNFPHFKLRKKEKGNYEDRVMPHVDSKFVGKDKKGEYLEVAYDLELYNTDTLSIEDEKRFLHDYNNGMYREESINMGLENLDIMHYQTPELEQKWLALDKKDGGIDEIISQIDVDNTKMKIADDGMYVFRFYLKNKD